MGTIDAHFQVEHGIIKAVRFYGDFFGEKDVQLLERQLIGRPYDYDSLQEMLDQNELQHYFTGIKPHEILQLIAP